MTLGNQHPDHRVPVACPQCRREYRLAWEKLGARVRCPACQHVFQAAALEAAAPAPDSGAPAGHAVMGGATPPTYSAAPYGTASHAPVPPVSSPAGYPAASGAAPASPYGGATRLPVPPVSSPAGYPAAGGAAPPSPCGEATGAQPPSSLPPPLPWAPSDSAGGGAGGTRNHAGQGAIPAPAHAAVQAPAYDPAQPPPRSSAAGLCPVCQSPLAAGEPKCSCPDCHGVHHKDCWDYNRGCGKYGCPSAPETEKLTEMEMPQGYWGQSQKNCPACGQMIQAAAVRCRFCGASFGTAKPLHTAEFRANRAVENDLPGIRRASIWLLVCCILPCTSPIATIIGGVWYMNKRDRVAALPATQAALPKIALLIGVVESILLVLAIVLYNVVGGHE